MDQADHYDDDYIAAIKQIPSGTRVVALTLPGGSYAVKLRVSKLGVQLYGIYDDQYRWLGEFLTLDEVKARFLRN